MLASASRLQQVVPDAVLVGGAAAAWYAGRSRWRRCSCPGGKLLRVPTLPEMLRVKVFLVVQRNQVRDHLDTVALADRIGEADAVSVLVGIDEYYADRSGEADSVLTAVVQRLSEPAPRDHRLRDVVARERARRSSGRPERT